MRVKVDAHFPGGNIVVESIRGDVVRLRQDLRDTEGDWFYWCFRAKGPRKAAVRFEFTGSNVLGTRGPAASLDGGWTWRWLGAESVTGQAFTYAFPPERTEPRFSFGMPYVGGNLRRFIGRHAGALQVSTLCRSREGRQVEMLRSGTRGAPFRVLLTCRHHACEMMANYALEGLFDELLADETDAGRWLLEHADVLAMPFMDRDGVENGDQGKNRCPHDHNRDYGDACIYPEVQSLRTFVPGWIASKPLFALDLHCPWIRSKRNETLYLVGSPSPENWEQIGRFSRLLEEEAERGPLPYRAADNLPFGVDWNTHAYDGPLRTFSRWAQALPGALFASTMEIPYASVGGAEVTADSARGFGRTLARAIGRFLQG